MHAWSSNGESSNKRISYVQFIRSQSTSFLSTAVMPSMPPPFSDWEKLGQLLYDLGIRMYYYFWGNKDFVNIA